VLLPLFYSKQFAGAAPLVTAYMPGEFCFQFLTLLISYQLTVSRRRRYLAWSLGYVGLLFLVAALAIPRLGAEGYVAAHVSSAAVMVAIASFLCWSSGQVKGRTLLLAGALLALLALISAALLIEHIAPGAWMIVALLPFAVSGAVVGAQLLSGMGLFKLRSSQA
jgi:O-antigen/teichoic acid export membrane protein